MTIARKQIATYHANGILSGRAIERREIIKLITDEHVGESIDDECDNDSDAAYNCALRHCISLIQARSFI